MTKFRFENGKNEETNLAGMLEQIYIVFCKTLMLAAQSDKPVPMDFRTGLSITLGMAFGIGALCNMSTETIIKGIKQYLGTYKDVEGVFTIMMATYGKPSYELWFNSGGVAARCAMKEELAEVAMLELATKYLARFDL